MGSYELVESLIIFFGMHQPDYCIHRPPFACLLANVLDHGDDVVRIHFCETSLILLFEFVRRLSGFEFVCGILLRLSE